MKTKLFRLFLPILLVFTLISCSNDSSEDLVADTTLITNYDSTSDEVELARLINLYRVSVEKNKLEIVNHISYKSQEHNLYMIQNNVVNHDFFESRAANIIQVLGAIKVGENIAYNYSTPNSALNAWLNSPEHKEKLDDDYTHFGISISVNPENGKKYFTNIFMKR